MGEGVPVFVDLECGIELFCRDNGGLVVYHLEVMRNRVKGWITIVKICTKKRFDKTILVF